MKTLRYRLTRRPSNLDDHLALAARAGCRSVAVVCIAQEVLHEAGPFWQWVAEVRFALPDGSLTCEVVCGASHTDASPATGRRDLDRADRRLAALLARLRGAGLAVASGATFRGCGRYVPSSRFPLWALSDRMAQREEMQ
jgi:hypothetical protein